MVLSVPDIHWIAGLLEGEGSFGASDKGRVPTVQCCMTDEDVLDRLQSLVPGQRLGPYRREGKPEWKPMHRWAVTGVRAVGVMQMLFPLLGKRRRARIEEVLAVWKTYPAHPTKRRTWKRRSCQSQESIILGREAGV